jgi:hypothetical protein
MIDFVSWKPPLGQGLQHFPANRTRCSNNRNSISHLMALFCWILVWRPAKPAQY